MTSAPELFIRADATPQIGAGHVMRTLSLAQAWPGKVTYLATTLPSWLDEKIKTEGFNYHPIPSPHPCSQDLLETNAILSKANNPWLIV